MTSGQSTVRLTRSLAKSMELENYVSPAKKTRMQDVTPPPTPDLKVIVLDAEPGLDHYELGVQNKPLTPPQKLSMKGTTRFELPTAVNYSDEETLWSLCPESSVDADVITALACHLTLDEVKRDTGRGRGVCFLPTELQDIVVNYGMTSAKALELYDTKFLSKAHNCRKVCLPMKDMMNDEGIHWYLAIILMDQKQIEFLNDLFDALHKEVQSTCAPPQIKEFTLTTPEVPTQRHKNDSGIWVCVWMMGSTWDDDYYIWPCNHLRRMQVALYLVKEPTNYIRHKVFKKANQNAPRFEAQTLEYKIASQERKAGSQKRLIQESSFPEEANSGLKDI
ncbi:unnamed protein product [Linum trigynum]|uniref:Ubiquitin-like protease family profile domain-containing protein n=1 Tax=Linum trigynum TaxID=586398 RepID=A0AAV2FQJ4_9ROSI